MKKTFLLFVVLMGVIVTVNAQTNPLKEYIGKYTFAPESPVAEIDLSAQDSVLIGSSALGTFQLEKKGLDTFYLAAYDANVIFRRAADKTIESVSIFAMGMELIGKKMTTTFALKEDDFYSQVWADKVK